MFKKQSLIFLFLSFIVFVGCSEPRPPQAQTSNEIGLAGGIMRTDNGVLLSIPPKALYGTFYFEISEPQQDISSYKKNYILVSSIILIKPDYQFPKGILAHVNLPLMKDKIPKDRALWDIQVYQFENTHWTKIPSIIDEIVPIISFDIHKTGIFAAFILKKS